jgi:hypothetical protein
VARFRVLTTAGNEPVAFLALDHLFDLASELTLHLRRAAQLALPLAGLLGQDVTVHRVMAQDFATASYLEALLGAAMGFLLGQDTVS